MKSDPASLALFDVLDESNLCGWRPGIWRVIQLDKQLVLCEEGIIDRRGVLDVVDGKAVFRGQIVEPDFRCLDEWQMDSALLGNCYYTEFRSCIWRSLCPSASTDAEQGKYS